MTIDNFLRRGDTLAAAVDADRVFLSRQEGIFETNQRDVARAVAM